MTAGARNGISFVLIERSSSTEDVAKIGSFVNKFFCCAKRDNVMVFDITSSKMNKIQTNSISF